MSPIELYNTISAALRTGDHDKAAELLPTLTTKLDALCGRGWFKFPDVGDETVDALIAAANRHMTGPVQTFSR